MKGRRINHASFWLHICNVNAEAIVSRIRQLLDWQQLSPTQFADRIGVGRPIISHILSERNKASLDVALRISTAFPEVSLEWLLKGTGQMLAADLTAPALPPQPALVATPPAAAVTIQAATPGVLTSAADTSGVLTARPQPSPRPAAARFQPGRHTATASPPESTAAAPASAEQTAPDAPLRPVSSSSIIPDIALPVSPVPLPASASDTEQMLAGFAEPGKAIRRIVIFYRDGSFADYQPEA